MSSVRSEWSVVIFICPRDCYVVYDFVPLAIPSSQDTDTSIIYFCYMNLSQELFGTKENLLQSVRGASIAQSTY